MPELSYSAYVARLSAASRRVEKPIACTFELTPTCNLRCHFCYVALDPYRGPYLSTEQVLSVLDVLLGAGVLLLTLTGGEVFSRRDFATIYREARRRGFVVTIFTNATLVREEHARMLAGDPPFAVEVSIYGADAEHYEAVTGIPGSFARFVHGIELLQRAGISPLMKHPISTLTVDHVDAIRAWCVARGLRHRFSTELENRHDGDATPALYRLDTRRSLALRDELYEAKTGEPRPLPLAECAVDDAEAGSARLYRCGAGRSSLFVDGLGNVSHCVIDRTPSFPILEMPWDEIHQRMLAWVNQPLPADAPCSGCDLRRGCDNCPARARLATGDPFSRDPHQCEITHAEHAAAATRTRPLGACVA